MKSELYWITGYDVYYKDRPLETIKFTSEEDWLKKDEYSKEKYRKMLFDFFKKVLIDEGKKKGEIDDDLAVMLTVREYRETRREKVIRLFGELDDNSSRNIASLTGALESSVNWILTRYLKK